MHQRQVGIAHLLRRLDTNGDGSISTHELEAGCQSLLPLSAG